MDRRPTGPRDFQGKPLVIHRSLTIHDCIASQKGVAQPQERNENANRCWQVRSGEVVTSARAMNEDTLKQLYDFNLSIPDVEFGPNSRKRKVEHPESWGGSAIRAMLEFAYILSFLCLLRYDETLTLRWHWIKLETVDGQRRLKVSLPCRKTHQLGGEDRHLAIMDCAY
jgi:hypothetical protein